MICIACSAENESHRLACNACGAQLAANSGWSRDDYEHAAPGSIEARVADIEVRLAALIEHYHLDAALRKPNAQRAGVAEAFETTRAIDAGPFRAIFGGSAGTVIAGAPDRAGAAAANAPATPHVDPPFDLRPQMTAALWEVLARGAAVVRVDSWPGAGATTLAERLVADAVNHEFDGAMMLTDVRALTAGDIAQRIAVVLAGQSPPQYMASSDFARLLPNRRMLVVLDRAALRPQDSAELRGLFPRCAFVTMQAADLPQVPAFPLGPLPADRAIALYESVLGRRIDADNRAVALGLFSSVGTLPGPIGVVAAIARATDRSAIALSVRHDSADSIVRAALAACTAGERRILDALMLAACPLDIADVAVISEAESAGDVEHSCARLAGLGLLRTVAPSLYELPAFIETFLPRIPVDAAVFARVVATLRAALTRQAADPVYDRRLAAARALLDNAFERHDRASIVALAPVVADALAERGSFTAWGTVLDTLTAAAGSCGDAAAVARAAHERGVRALLSGDLPAATTALEAARDQRARIGDRAGEAVTSAVLARVGDLAAHERTVAWDDVLDTPVRKRAEPDAPTAVPAAADVEVSAVPAAVDDVKAVESVPPAADETSGATATGVNRSAEGAEPAAATNRHAGATSAAAAPAVVTNTSDESQHAALAAKPSVPVVGSVHRGSSRPSREGVLLFTVSAIVVALLAFLLRPQPASTFAITQFDANPRTVARGKSAQLCLTATGAAAVEVLPDVGRMPSDGNHCVAVTPSATTTYLAVATRFDGSRIRDTVTLGVNPPRDGGVRILSFSATPRRIRPGQSTRLCYAVTGAERLRIAPRIADLTQLRSCRTVTLRSAHAQLYKLTAYDDMGHVAVRQLHVDVNPDRGASRHIAHAAHHTAVPDARVAAAVYQFDATPELLERGQAASLCVGVDRSARGFVTHLGRLQPGVTRCYRVAPHATTTYRLYVGLAQRTAVETVTVAVRSPARPARDVARLLHR